MRFLLLFLLAVVVAQENESEALKEFAIGNNQFSSDVYHEALKFHDNNFLICPLSTEIILSLLRSGAAGKTAQEVSSVLHLSEDREKTQQTFKELSALFQPNKYYELNSANKIYIQDGYQIKDTFKNTAIDDFNSDIENIKFGEQISAAAEINKWVEEKTNKKIVDIVKPNELKNDTRAVLINTMFFHGNWKSPFHKAVTTKKPFYLSEKHNAEVDMMNQRTTFKYYESPGLDAKFLEMPYAGEDITMTFVLPNTKEGLSGLENRIKDVFIEPIYENRMVAVTIPKFKLETEVNLKEILQNLGIQEAFGDQADLKEIVVDGSLKIDDVKQKTFIEIDEEGTTAAAVTHVRLPQLGIAVINPAQFIADHPFIFYIKLKNIVVFAGRYKTVTQ